MYWFQIKLRTVLVAMAPLCALIAMGVSYDRSARLQQRLADELAVIGVIATPFPVEIDPSFEPRGKRKTSALTQWLEKTLGPHYAYRLERVTVNEVLDDVALLRRLRGVRCLSGKGLNDAALRAVDPAELRYVDLRDRPASKWGIRHLSRSPFLQVLLIADCSLNDEDLRPLAALTQLQSLTLINIDIRGECFAFLPADQLKRLHIARCRLSRSASHHLHRFQQLNSLALIRSVDTVFVLGIGSLPKLRGFSLYGSPVTDLALKHFPTRYPALEEAYLPETKITQQGIAQVAAKYGGKAHFCLRR